MKSISGIPKDNYPLKLPGMLCADELIYIARNDIQVIVSFQVERMMSG